MDDTARAVILHTEASLGFGGQEIRILTELRWLLDHDWDSLLLCQPASRLLDEAHHQGLPVVPVRMTSAWDIGALFRVRRLLRERRVSIVHTHSSVDSWIGTLAARSRRLPVVRSRHVSISIRRGSLVYRLADRIITSGDAIRATVMAAGIPAERIVSIPPGVDTARFAGNLTGQAVRDELGLGGRPGTMAIGLVANLRGSKGHQYFLEAARNVLRERPNTRFLIVGDGVGSDSIRERVRGLGLERAVVLTGFRRDIAEVIAALDVLVLPSTRSEGVPQTILQALAVGRPVVASAVGGIPEVVRHDETGLLVPPGDSIALACAVLSLLDDPSRARRLVMAGRELVQVRYGLDRSMACTTRVYADVLATASHAVARTTVCDAPHR